MKVSKAKANFDIAIQDAERILEAYDKLNQTPDKEREPEELKRAALIMSLTAWETYVEDRVTEEISDQMRPLEGSQVAKFVNTTLKKDLRYFHTPNSRKTQDIFERFLDVDVTTGWAWPGYEPKTAKGKLDEWIKKRGEAVHRSITNKQSSHLVNRQDAEKCINFFKNIADATDRILSFE